jgi:hypothetical protein
MADTLTLRGAGGAVHVLRQRTPQSTAEHVDEHFKDDLPSSCVTNQYMLLTVYTRAAAQNRGSQHCCAVCGALGRRSAQFLCTSALQLPGVCSCMGPTRLAFEPSGAPPKPRRVTSSYSNATNPLLAAVLVDHGKTLRRQQRFGTDASQVQQPRVWDNVEA